ncbi:MAG: single-stranded DNA-binding protein [Bacilli bacterium]|jgi:single-strand DNA-binding protein|nr:single-stranded DNA-binding protein [Bacilli bacterium]
MNKVFLIGRLTKDPELKYLGSEVPVARFTLAVNRPYSNSNNEKKADFINIVAWRRQAEVVGKYLVKGSQIAIDGMIQTRNYENKDGVRVYITEVIADRVKFLDSKSGGSTQGKTVTPQDFNETEANTTDVSEDPFADFGDSIELTEDDIAF